MSTHTKRWSLLRNGRTPVSRERGSASLVPLSSGDTWMGVGQPGASRNLGGIKAYEVEG